MSSMIRVRNLCYQVGNHAILQNLSFTVNQSKMISVIGSNSCGKTTLLKTLAGILPTHNMIDYSRDICCVKSDKIDLKKLGCVFSDDSTLFEDVYHEFIFPLENLNYSVEEIQARIQYLVDTFEVSYLLDKKIIDLTKEEEELTKIILALLHSPKVLIMDQPFLMMRRSFKQKVIAHLLEIIQKEQITVILSATNLEDILFTDYVYVLDQGEIVMEGDTLAIMKEDVRLKKLGLELPFMVDLSLMLEFYEILDDVYLDVQDLVVKLWS